MFQPCVIDDCGELQPGEDDGICVDDGTGDLLPDWPEDSELVKAGCFHSNLNTIELEGRGYTKNVLKLVCGKRGHPDTIILTIIPAHAQPDQ